VISQACSLKVGTVEPEKTAVAKQLLGKHIPGQFLDAGSVNTFPLQRIQAQ
jgi:hypothetical protein